MIKALPGAIRSLNRNSQYQGWFVSLWVAGGGGFKNCKAYLPQLWIAYRSQNTLWFQIWRNQESQWLLLRHKGLLLERSNHTSIASPPRLRQLCEREGEELKTRGMNCCVGISPHWNLCSEDRSTCNFPGSRSCHEMCKLLTTVVVNVSSTVSSLRLWRELQGCRPVSLHSTMMGVSVMKLYTHAPDPLR